MFGGSPFESVIWYRRIKASNAMRGRFQSVRGMSRRRGSLGYSWMWGSVMDGMEDLGAPEKAEQGLTGLLQGGGDQPGAGDQDQVEA